MVTTPHHSARQSVYLDHNATTPVAPEVFARMRPWLEECWGNPSSSHTEGQRARRAVDRAREQVAALIGASADEIVFTSGGTESNNWVLFGAVPSAVTLAVSAIEHPAISQVIGVLEDRGRTCVRLAVAVDGRVDLDAARRSLASGCGFVSVMLAHNETGVVQPVAELAQWVRSIDPAVVVHSDAAQAVGKIPVDVHQLDVDLLTLAGHKFGAPKGIGALYVRRGTALQPLLYGGGQQGGRRPGTEPVPLIVALGAAAELAAREIEAEGSRQRALREQLWNHLSTSIHGMWRVADTGSWSTLPNTLFCCFPGIDGARLLSATEGVSASTGSACHSDDDRAGGVLTSMGVASELRRGAVRLSLGRTTTAHDIDFAAQCLITAWRRHANTIQPG